MHEIKLCKPIWKKTKTVFCTFCGKKIPRRDVLSQKYQPVRQPFQSVAQICVRFKKITHQKIQLHIPLSSENSSSKEESMPQGLYLAVIQSEYIGKNRGLKGRVRADWRGRQAVSEAINSLMNTGELRCCIPIRPVTFRAFFLSDILMASFMEISHFPCLSTWKKRHIFFLSKGYRQGNTGIDDLLYI